MDMIVKNYEEGAASRQDLTGNFFAIISEIKSKKHSRTMVNFIALLATIISLVLWSTNAFSATLSKSEEKILQDYVQHVAVEDGAGQLLMVGLPVDFINYPRASVLKTILADLGIGSVIVNGYNYYDESSEHNFTKTNYLDQIIVFNNAMQEISVSSPLKLPLLFAADFEGPRFSTIKYGVLLPPSALAISATQDKDYIRYTGRLVGMQLMNLGIHVILGPVLDTYNVTQGNDSTLQDRCYGSNPKIVAATASHYIKGLKEAGIAIFAKHFPSHGSVEAVSDGVDSSGARVSSNPHRGIPNYSGSLQQLEDEMKPFQLFNESFDGMMSAHIRMTQLSNGDIATFSREFITDRMKAWGFENQIKITDDLSSMGAIKQYRAETNDSLATVVIKAFEAGHDILLLSHFAESNKGKSTMTIEELKSVLSQLVAYIKNDKHADTHFRDALLKILRLKARVAKDLNSTVTEMLSKNKKYAIYKIHNSGPDALLNSQKFLLKVGDPSIDTGEKLISEILKKATIEINVKGSYNLLKQRQKKLVFCIPAGYVAEFKQAFGDLFQQRPEFIAIPELKNRELFRSVEKKIFNSFDKADKLIYLAVDKSDADLLARLRNAKSSFGDKIIIFCHVSPFIFSEEVLSDSTLISIFTNHPDSFGTVIQVLKGDLTPRKLVNLPINLGKNGTFYNAGGNPPIEPADTSKYEDLFPTYYSGDYENRMSEKLRRENVVIPKNLRSVIFYILWCVVVGILSITWVRICKGSSKIDEEGTHSPFTWKFWLIKVMENSKMVIILFIVLNVVAMFYMNDVSNIIHDIRLLIKGEPLGN